MKILYVEDNKVNALVMKKILDTHDLSLAYTGPDGIRYATEAHFDLILLDINLGCDEMDGCDVLKFLRTMDAYKTTPIFAVTAYALPKDEARFRAEGFDEYFSKHVKYDELQRKISECINFEHFENSNL